MTVRRPFVGLALLLAVVVPLAGCVSGVPSETLSVLNGNDILTADLETGVTARGVVLAAVLLVAGNVEKGLKKGVVTQAEVDEARQAVADGTLDMWRQRAEADGGATP